MKFCDDLHDLAPVGDPEYKTSKFIFIILNIFTCYGFLDKRLGLVKGQQVCLVV